MFKFNKSTRENQSNLIKVIGNHSAMKEFLLQELNAQGITVNTVGANAPAVEENEKGNAFILFKFYQDSTYKGNVFINTTKVVGAGTPLSDISYGLFTINNEQVILAMANLTELH